MVFALLAAIAVHLAVLVIVVRLRGPDPLSDELAEAVPVEMVPLSALGPPPPVPAVPVAPAPAAPGEETLPTDAPPPTAAAPATPTQPREDMVRPTTMLSSRSLAASRQARLAMRTLASDTRVEQLCGLEAMEQVHAWQRDFQPDRIVVYAMGEPSLTGNRFEADGAAFRSRSLWYRIRFSCDLTTDHARVVGFAFAVGAPIPRDDWEEHGLPAVH